MLITQRKSLICRHMQADIAIEQAKLEAMEEEIRVAEAIEGKEWAY